MDDKKDTSYFDYIGWQGDTLLYRSEGYAALVEKVFSSYRKRSFYFPDSLKESIFLIFTDKDTITWNSNNPSGFSGHIESIKPYKSIKGKQFRVFVNKFTMQVTSHAKYVYEIYADKQLGIIFFNYNDGENTYNCWLDKTAN